jgi:hypothetical protein
MFCETIHLKLRINKMDTIIFELEHFKPIDWRNIVKAGYLLFHSGLHSLVIMFKSRFKTDRLLELQ